MRYGDSQKVGKYWSVSRVWFLIIPLKIIFTFKMKESHFQKNTLPLKMLFSFAFLTGISGAQEDNIFKVILLQRTLLTRRCPVRIALEPSVINSLSFLTEGRVLKGFENQQILPISISKLSIQPKNIVANRYLSHCENVLIKATPTNFENEGNFLNRNTYLIYGDKLEVENVFGTFAASLLKTKIGIDVKDEEVYIRDRNNNIRWMALSSETLSSAFKTSTLKNGHFKIAVWKIEPHLVAAEVGKKNLGVSYGYALAAANVYNFTFDLSFPARQLMHPNGSWAGTMADLHYRRIDMTLMLSPTVERLEAVSFSTHALELRLIFLTALPLARVNWRAFEVPFSNTVWFATFFTLCSVALCIYVRLRLDPATFKAHEVYQTTFTLSYCPLLMQAVKIPREIRFFTLMWIVMSFILVNFYCSEILSAITIPTKEHIPEDFQELGTREDYQVNMMYFPGAAGDNFFKSTQKLEYQNLNQRMFRVKDFLGCVLSAALDKKKACISWDSIGYPLVAKNLTLSRGILPVVQSREAVTQILLHPALQKDSKHLESFGGVVSRLRDTGHTYKWIEEIKNYNEKKGISWLKTQERSELKDKLVFLTESLKSTVEAFHIHQMLTPFGILFSGVFTALIIFSIEYEVLKFLNPGVQAARSYYLKIIKFGELNQNGLDNIDKNNYGKL